MIGLAEVLHTLAARPGVETVVLVSPDGLPIQHAGRTATDGDALAALAATAHRQAVRLSDGAGQGALRTMVLESEGGVLVLSDAGVAGHVLLLSVSPDAAFGDLLYDLRSERAALGALL